MATGKQSSKNGTITASGPSKYIIGLGIDPETVLRLDSNGDILNFEMKEGFLELSDTVLSKLSRENRTRYEIAKEFHDSWRGDEHAKLVEEFKVDPMAKGSATDKLSLKVQEDMDYYWAAPYNIEAYRAKGWHIASPDEAKTFLGPKGGHHEVGALGQTELVLMLRPKEISERNEKRKVEENEQKAGMWRENGLAQIGEGGFDASGDDRRNWTDIPQEQ